MSHPAVSIPAVRLISVDDLHAAAADVLAVAMGPTGDGTEGSDGAAPLPPDLAAVHGLELAGYLAHASGTGPASGKAGEIVAIPLPGTRPGGLAEVHVVGVGDRSPAAYRRAGAALAKRVKGRHRLASAVGFDADDERLQAFVEGLVLASYTFSRRSTPPKAAAVAEVALVVASPDVLRPALERALVTVRAVWRARDLTNTPSNEKDPAWLAAQAEQVAAATGLAVRVWDEAALAAGGFGGLLAVGSGSARPPRLVSLSYEPEDTARPGEPGKLPHIVLVGKGITFDSGGLSIKPREGMVAMKADMAGGATVIAVLGALRDLGVRVRVTGLVAAAENLPSGSAYRPADVITQYGGTTVEILNTDAEGRIVLADALAYADRVLQPDVIVDVATLTGAATMALSRRVGAMYATDDELAHALLDAAAAGGDALWRMPLADDYRNELDSDIADICHIPRNHRGAGSITAALFLREFVGGRRWAHLDIAGPGKVDAVEHEITKGGTGFGVRTLLRWLASYG